MATIGHVMETCSRARLGMRYFGCSDRWRREFDEHVTRLGKAIVLDVRDSAGANDLSPKVQLGQLGELAYLSLRLFIQFNSEKRTSNLL